MGGRERPLTVWSRGRLGRGRGAPRLLFGRMHEDWTLDAEVLPAHGRIFCVASAGCTAFALAARGARVTAVDVNPVQVDYLRARISGEPPRLGAAERRFAGLRRLGPLVGWDARTVREFAELGEPCAQARFWREWLDTRRFRGAAGLVLHPLVLRLAYAAPLLAPLPSRFDAVLRRRLGRGFARHPNRGNPYARFLLLGHAEQPEPRPVELACADAAAYLEQAAPASFDGFSLSNVLDGAPAGYAERLDAAVRHAAAPGAVSVLRSFGEPATAEEDELAARDRGLIWGLVRIERR